MKILIRYGEIALKSPPVRKKMEKTLSRNIISTLKRNGIQGKIQNSFGRIFLDTEEGTFPALSRIPGIVSFSPCLECRSEIQDIKSLALEISGGLEFSTFAVKTSRFGSHKFNSNEVNRTVGEEIRVGTGKKVNLSNPDILFSIEVRDNKTYVYTKIIPGLGGLPVGTQGKIHCIIEKEDDILAAWLFWRRGCKIIPVTKNPGLLKPLEKWTGELRYKNEIQNPIGIVSEDLGLKGKYSCPVYNPLLGLTKKDKSSLMDLVNNI